MTEKSRENRILEAAAELFYQHGFASVGVDDIGSAAGMTGPAIYRYFRSKDELLATLMHVAMDRLLMLVGDVSGEPEEALGRLINGQIRWVLEQRVLNGVYVREGRSLTGTHRQQVRQRELDHLRRWIDTVAACYPERSPADVRLSVNAALGLLLSTVWWPKELRTTPGVREKLYTLVRATLAEPLG